MITELPILFKGEMVRPILADIKTQTRRTRKLDGINKYPDVWQDVRCFDDVWSFRDGILGSEELIRCPYGKPGDRLWVRESYRFGPGYNGVAPRHVAQSPNPIVQYEADDFLRTIGGRVCDERTRFTPGDLRPSIHMPRAVSRITLKITDIRVERLQDISEEDAKAEGAAFTCEYCGNDLDDEEGAAVHAGCDEDSADGCASHREGYRRLWNTINGPGSWDLNPYLWVVGFKRVAA